MIMVLEYITHIIWSLLAADSINDRV